MKTYQRTSEEYKRIFDTAMNEGQPIFSSDRQELILQENEEFCQCFKAGDPVRKNFPKSWFVSNYCNLISTFKGHVEWLKMDTNDPKRPTYHFYLNDRIKIIAAYNLAGLCHNAPIYGKAKEYLENEGLYAFGNRGKLNGMQGHHFKDRQNYPKLICDVSNIEFVSIPAHEVADSIPPMDADEETKLAWVKKFGKIAADEAPNSFSVAMDVNGEKGLFETKELLVTENFLKELQQLASLIDTWEKYMFYMPQIQKKQAELSEKNIEKGE